MLTTADRPRGRRLPVLRPAERELRLVELRRRDRRRRQHRRPVAVHRRHGQREARPVARDGRPPTSRSATEVRVVWGEPNGGSKKTTVAAARADRGPRRSSARCRTRSPRATSTRAAGAPPAHPPRRILPAGRGERPHAATGCFEGGGTACSRVLGPEGQGSARSASMTLSKCVRTVIRAASGSRAVMASIIATCSSTDTFARARRVHSLN